MFRKQPEVTPVGMPEREPAPPASPEWPGAAAPEPRGEATRVAPSITVKGELSGREDLFFDGTLEGRICMPDSRIVVGPNGRVQADIEASEIIVEGRVAGNLRGQRRVELRRTSQVRGDVTTERIAIQDGAQFHGRVEVVRGEEARVARAVSASAGGESYPAVPVSATGEPGDSLH
jgi:cytoskeletal protein CcmA (bactofilin family)